MFDFSVFLNLILILDSYLNFSIVNEKEIERLEMEFKNIDKNKDGYLDPVEFRDAIGPLFQSPGLIFSSFSIFFID